MGRQLAFSNAEPRWSTQYDWLTPPGIVQALGRFDLDPCAHPQQPWRTAATHYCLPDQDGLALAWSGRVWLNPPYGRDLAAWLQRLALHGRGTAMVFARTETDAFQRWVWPHATALLFLYGRVHFHLPDGARAATNAGAPSVLIAYGDADAAELERTALRGALVKPLRT